MMIRLCRVRKWIHNTIIPTILIHQINLMDRLNPQLTLFMKILQMKLRIIYTLTALRRPFIRLEAVLKMIRCITPTRAGSSKSLTTFTFALLNPKHPKFPQNLSHKNTTMIVTVTKRTTRVTTKWVAVVWCPAEWWLAKIWVLLVRKIMCIHTDRVTITQSVGVMAGKWARLRNHSPSTSFPTASKRFATMATFASFTLWRKLKLLKTACDI